MDWTPPYGSSLGSCELDGEDKQHQTSPEHVFVIPSHDPTAFRSAKHWSARIGSEWTDVLACMAHEVPPWCIPLSQASVLDLMKNLWDDGFLIFSGLLSRPCTMTLCLVNLCVSWNSSSTFQRLRLEFLQLNEVQVMDGPPTLLMFARGNHGKSLSGRWICGGQLAVGRLHAARVFSMSLPTEPASYFHGTRLNV